MDPGHSALSEGLPVISCVVLFGLEMAGTLGRACANLLFALESQIPVEEPHLHLGDFV